MVRPNDQSIADDASFLRALTLPDWWTVMEDRTRVNSVAFFTFREEPGETSCYSNTPAGREIFGRRYPTNHAGRFTADQARKCGFNISPDPEGDVENSPEHFVLTHATETKRKPYQRACKQLALKAEFVTAETLAIERCADLNR